MASPPTWAPLQGEVYGDWVGVRAPGQSLIFWEYQSESEQQEKVTKSYGASSNGVQIDGDVDFAIIQSESSLHAVILPAAHEVGLGSQIYIQAGDVAFRIRCKNEIEEILNGKVCSNLNELFIPRRCFVSLTVVGDAEWLAIVHNPDGVQIPANPVSRSSVELTNEYGYQVLTAIDPTDIYTEYDGVDDYFASQGVSLANGNSAFSIGAWIYNSDPSVSVANAIAGEWDSTQKEFLFYANSANQMAYNYSDDATTTRNGITALETVTDNTWVHVVYTQNSTEVKLYVNGAIDVTEAYAGTGTMNDGATVFGIGAYNINVSLGGFWNGRISHLVIEDGVTWNAGTVTNIYNSAPPPTAYYFPLGNGTEKRKNLQELTKNSQPITVDNVPTISSNAKRCSIIAENTRQLVRGPQLRAGQECVVRTDTTHKMIFPRAVNGGDIIINDNKVSDWKKIMTVSANFNYHFKALTDNEYEVLEVYYDGTVTAASFT